MATLERAAGRTALADAAKLLKVAGEVNVTRWVATQMGASDIGSTPLWIEGDAILPGERLRGA